MTELKKKKFALKRANIGLEEKYPIKIVQFGEGNFLRAFVDYALFELNKTAGFNAGVAVVQPIDRGLIDMLNAQDGLFTLFMKGVKNERIIDDIALIDNIVKGINPYKSFEDYLSLAKEDTLEFVISNTTEAGIAYVESDRREMQPPSSFPAKLTVLLFERFKHFDGDKDKGLTILPCELINYNGDKLKEIILRYCSDWDLGVAFNDWLQRGCSFHNTLVDRIVPGYPKDELNDYNARLDYSDSLIVTAETFFLWVIEGDEKLKKKLPFDRTDLDVKIVADMQPYRTRKVRILNGAHTALVPFSILFGNQTVKETVETSFTGNFIRKAVFNEIIDTLDMDRDELHMFAEEIFDRFRNPFVKHQLSSIALNSISKFKVRVLPSLVAYIELYGKVPVHLTFAFACLIRFYKGDWQGKELPINDSVEIVDEFQNIWKLNDYPLIAKTTLSNAEFWDQDLSKFENLVNEISVALKEIDTIGIEAGFEIFSRRL